MTKTRVLIILLRFLGITAMLALVAVFMPFSWMIAVHSWLGLGEMPASPIVEYLARSLSVFYAFFGSLCLVIAGDMERYRPMVRFLGFAFVIIGIVLWGIDVAAGMPWWWSVFEGPPAVVTGILILWLGRQEQ